MGWVLGLGNGIVFRQGGSQNWSSYWSSLISATVENAEPTNVVLTFPSARTSLGASDFTIAGFTISSASWTGAVLTLVLSIPVIYNDTLVVTFVPTSETANVTNNVTALLNTYTGATAAYSVRLLNSDYTGSCLRVRRSSDNAEQDIGFVNKILDTASLLTFVGVGDGFVVKWYDQSGNGNNIELDGAAQPKMISAGTLVTQEDGTLCVPTDGVATYLFATINALTNASALSVFIAHSSTLAAAANTNSSVFWSIGNYNVDSRIVSRQSASGFLTGEYLTYDIRRTTTGKERLGSSTYRRSVNEFEIMSDFVLSTGLSGYKNGVAINIDLSNGGATTGTDYTPATGNLTNKIYFGCILSASSPAGFTANKFSEIILYVTDKSASRIAIENNQGLFFLNNVLNEQNLELASNPYSEINFATVNQYKANFHTHSTESDAQASNTVQGVAEAYSNYGYKILAITDHDTYPSYDPDPTWALSDFSAYEPSAVNALAEYYPDLDLLMIKGNELTNHPTTLLHRTSLLCELWTPQQIIDDFATKKNDIDWTLAKIGEMGGVSFINHISERDYGVDYNDIMNDHSSCLGIEVYNEALIKYNGKNDVATWDTLLNALMPTRQVWGFSNTDDHILANYIGKCYNVMLMPELTEAALRTALTSGRFYFVYDPLGTQIARHNPVVTPIITNISEANDVITITASNCSKIEWIYNGVVLQEGSSFDIKNYSGLKYVRARLTGVDGSFAFTQAFGITTI